MSQHCVDDWGTNPVTTIAFSSAAIHFSTAYNLHHYQRQFLSYHAYKAWEVKDPLSR